MHTADVDGDGDTDVLACFYLSNEITWFRNNNGLGTSWTRIRIGGASGARNVRTADMNGDGTLDLVATSVLDRAVAWYRGTGGGNFAARQVISTQNSEYRGLHLADVDQDGDLDVFTTSEANNRVDWYENLGGGSFSSSYIITNSMTGANHVNSADMDGDGVLDILASAPGNNRVVWYENEFDPNTLGTNYCTAAFHSLGIQARMSAVGSNVVADNDLTLEAHDLPNNTIGIFLVGPDRANLPERWWLRRHPLRRRKPRPFRAVLAGPGRRTGADVLAPAGPDADPARQCTHRPCSPGKPGGSPPGSVTTSSGSRRRTSLTVSRSPSSDRPSDRGRRVRVAADLAQARPDLSWRAWVVLSRAGGRRRGSALQRAPGVRAVSRRGGSVHGLAVQ